MDDLWEKGHGHRRESRMVLSRDRQDHRKE